MREELLSTDLEIKKLLGKSAIMQTLLDDISGQVKVDSHELEGQMRLLEELMKP